MISLATGNKRANLNKFNQLIKKRSVYNPLIKATASRHIRKPVWRISYTDCSHRPKTTHPRLEIMASRSKERSG